MAGALASGEVSWTGSMKPRTGSTGSRASASGALALVEEAGGGRPPSLTCSPAFEPVAEWFESERQQVRLQAGGVQLGSAGDHNLNTHVRQASAFLGLMDQPGILLDRVLPQLSLGLARLGLLSSRLGQGQPQRPPHPNQISESISQPNLKPPNLPSQCPPSNPRPSLSPRLVCAPPSLPSPSPQPKPGLRPIPSGPSPSSRWPAKQLVPRAHATYLAQGSSVQTGEWWCLRFFWQMAKLVRGGWALFGFARTRRSARQRPRPDRPPPATQPATPAPPGRPSLARSPNKTVRRARPKPQHSSPPLEPGLRARLVAHPTRTSMANRRLGSSRRACSPPASSRPVNPPLGTPGPRGLRNAGQPPRTLEDGLRWPPTKPSLPTTAMQS